MANFPSPSQIQTNYLSILQSIKPSLNPNDANSDFVIRGKVISGLLSGVYGDQANINNDTFVSTARLSALLLKGQDYGIPQSPATSAQSTSVQISGSNGTIVNPGDLTFQYVPTSVLYTNTTGGTISGGVLILTVKAESTGQIGNIKAPATLLIVSPPSGVNSSASLLTDMTDGSDIESTDSYRSRILTRIQTPPAGGNETDYPQFAFNADPSVRSAFIKRFGRGLGTVDVYITVGTTDIDNAVTNGLPILRIPSPTVLANVQAYYDAHVPLTDCPGVFAPTEVNVPVTVNAVLATGLSPTSIPADPVNNPLGLNCTQLVQREISRVLYKLPVGGRQIPGFTNGFVTASDIEEGLDVWLSAVKDPVSGLFEGIIPILADRQCQKLNSPDYNLPLTEAQLSAPGTLTVVYGGI